MRFLLARFLREEAVGTWEGVGVCVHHRIAGKWTLRANIWIRPVIQYYEV